MEKAIISVTTNNSSCRNSKDFWKLEAKINIVLTISTLKTKYKNQ